jgi:hypothetical protein
MAVYSRRQRAGRALAGVYVGLADPCPHQTVREPQVPSHLGDSSSPGAYERNRVSLELARVRPSGLLIHSPVRVRPRGALVRRLNRQVRRITCARRRVRRLDRLRW